MAGLYYAYQGILGAERRFGLLAVGFIAYALAKLLGIVVLLALGVTVEGALIVNVVATFGGIACFGGRTGAGMFDGASASVARGLLRLAVPMSAYLILSQALLSVDLGLLNALGVSKDQAGRYAAAGSLARALTVVPSALSGVVFSSLSRALSHDDHELVRHHVRSGGRFALTALVPCAAFAALNAEPIMRFVYAETYAGGGRFFALLVVVFALAGILDVYGHTLMAAGRERVVWRTILVALLTVLVLDWLWIPRFGGEGAAGAAVAALALGLLVLLVFVGRHFHTLLPTWTLPRVLLAAGVGCAVGARLDTSGIWVLAELALLCIVYGIVLIATGEVSRQDLRRVLPW